MIRVTRPSTKPEILLTKGARQTEQDKTAYDTDPNGYRSGNRKFQSKKIYGNKSVKDALLNAQHSKCCYCEAKIGATSHGEVEHYRPKGAVKQSVASNMEYPGYYWLAYDWDNLLVSCAVCNRKKSFLFPLENEVVRARSHHDNIQDEKPLFINPAKDEPREHICFRGEEPVPVTELGRKTIECLQLRRPALQECRRKRLQELESSRDLIDAEENSDNPNLQVLIRKAKEQLKKAIKPEAKFSSMAQDFLHPRVSVQRQTPIW